MESVYVTAVDEIDDEEDIATTDLWQAATVAAAAAPKPSSSEQPHLRVQKSEHNLLAVCHSRRIPSLASPNSLSLPGPRLPVAAVDVAKFLQNLPKLPLLNPEEDALRSAVFTACVGTSGALSHKLRSLKHVEKKSHVVAAASALLPEGVSLGAWIEARLDGELALKEIAGDMWLEILFDQISWKNQLSVARENLPDEVTPGEVALRDAVIDFLSRWEAFEPPQDYLVLRDASVAAARDALPAELAIPAVLTFRKWCLRRVPEYIESHPDINGNMRICLAGVYDVDNVAQMGEPDKKTRKELKRKAEEMEALEACS